MRATSILTSRYGMGDSSLSPTANSKADVALNAVSVPLGVNLTPKKHAAGSPPLYLPSYAFGGLIDEVRVSAAALYTSNFTAGLGPGSNVRGLWKFDGSTANDFSGNGNNGTLTLLTGSFDSEDAAAVRHAVEKLLSEKCDDAFQAAGILSPGYIMSNTGIVLGAATLLMGSANNSSSGITEYARKRDRHAVGSTGIQAITIRNHPGKKPDTTDDRARIFLNRSAFSGGVYSLQEVITHEFMHVAGMEVAYVPIYGGLIRQHDLSYVKNYNSIIEACK